MFRSERCDNPEDNHLQIFEFFSGLVCVPESVDGFPECLNR